MLNLIIDYYVLCLPILLNKCLSVLNFIRLSNNNNNNYILANILNSEIY